MMHDVEYKSALGHLLASRENFGILSQTTVQEVKNAIRDHIHKCRLCWALSKEGQRYPVNTILMSTNDCHLIPALGALTPGYVLLVHKEHFRSTGTLLGSEIQEIESQLNQVFDILELHFSDSKWVAFEHGTTVSYGIKACCVDHLHFHILPCEFDLVKELRTRLSCKPEQIQSLKHLPDALAGTERNYILVRTKDYGHQLFLPQVYSSQYVRQVIANQLGLNGKWDWREYPFESTSLSTLKTFRARKVAPKVIYYAHPIEGLPEEDIRNQISRTQDLLQSSLRSVRMNSMFDFLHYTIESQGVIPQDSFSSFLVETETRYLRSCDLLLVDLSKPGCQYVGALMEIVYAALNVIPIVAITGETGLEERQWLTAHVDHFAPDLEQALPVIAEILGDTATQKRI